MSSAAPALIAIAVVPGMIFWVLHEVRAAIAGLKTAAAAPLCVDVRLIEGEAHTPRPTVAGLPGAPDQWHPDQWCIAA